MLTPVQLEELRRDLADEKVLSVYLDTRVTDPAMRHSWRPSLHSAIRGARAQIADEAERAIFDRAAEYLRDPESPPGGVWGSPGWVAFVTTEGPRYMADLPVRPATLAAWREGPVVAPYLRALKQHRPVIVAMVESRSARLYRYASRKLELLEELSAPAEEGTGERAAKVERGGSHHAPRGAVDTEAASRHRRAAFQRLATELSERIVHHAGDFGWVLIGGTTEWARQAGEALPRALQKRVLVSTTLGHAASEDEIGSAAKQAATELRGAHGRVLVDELLERAGTQARAAVGYAAVQRALMERAVDLLLVSPEFIRAREGDAEDAVRAALGQGADVEVPSGDAAEKLDGAGSGIAARLRFAI